MRTYHVSLLRENPEHDLSDLHYYVILDAMNREEAEDRALGQAGRDYPGDLLTLDSCRETTPKNRNGAQRSVLVG